MGKAFQPYLAQLVPLLLEVVTESDLVNAPDDDDEEEEEDDDEEGGPGQMYINVMDGFVNNKKVIALTPSRTPLEYLSNTSGIPHGQTTLQHPSYPSQAHFSITPLQHALSPFSNLPLSPFINNIPGGINCSQQYG